MIDEKKTRFTFPTAEETVELAEGVRFSARIDPDDERFVLMETRFPHMIEGDVPPPVDLVGDPAVQASYQMCVSNTISSLLTRDPEFAQTLIEKLKELELLDPSFSIRFSSDPRMH